MERWIRGEIGFHQNEVNPYLIQYWQKLNIARDDTVFVPLCGKSLDMIWLRKQGHTIFGVELSDIAIQAFFKENGFEPQYTSNQMFARYESDGICIMCGDFFDMSKEDLKSIRAVYDRASLIALPPEMRERYARHLVGLLPPATKILLVTVEYPQTQMQGPPFSVTTDEVSSLYSEHAEVRLLTKLDVLANNPRFQERGLSSLQESIFMLTLC